MLFCAYVYLPVDFKQVMTAAILVLYYSIFYVIVLYYCILHIFVGINKMPVSTV